MASLFARTVAFVLGLFAFATVHAQTYTYTFYVGNTNANGCTVATPAGSVGHVKWRLQATVTAGVAPTFGSVTRADCNNGVFGSTSNIASTSAIGLNTGSGGADVIEVRVPVGSVGPTPSPREVLAVVASSNTASDGLIATAFTKGGPPPATDPIMIPTFGTFAIALLGLALLTIGWFVLRRHANVLLVSLLLVSGTAWAVAIVIDGQVGDWASVTPSTDPVGDVPEAGVDLVALYVTTQGGDGFVRVDVKDLQNPPVADDGSAELLEDDSTTITLTGSDPANGPLTFQIASSPTRGTLGPIVPINATSASVLYTGNADEFGSDSFTFTVDNGSQTSTPATVDVTITPVNDAPSFSAADPAAVNEGSGAQSVAGWASFDPGPANESAQTALEYQVSAIGNPALFAVAPSVDASGTLSYTPAANANGTSSFSVAVRDDGGTANGGVDLSATQNFTITINAVNAAPSFTGGGNVPALEDAGAQLVAGWASAIDDGDPDANQALAFNVTANSNPALFAAGPAVDPTSGDLTYTPAADANGSAQITLTLSDDGGTANGGSDTSTTYQFTVQIDAVNDAPSFVAVDPPAVNEGSGAQTVVGWAAFDAGPSDESGQAVLEYQVSAIGNPALFTVAPSVDDNGTLTYTLAANVSGDSSFTVAVRDDGGTANGGVDLSAAQNFTITVNAVNSAPSFTGGGDVSSDEDAGAQTFAGWATAIDDGDPDQVQALSFSVTGNSNPSLFSTAPAVNAATGDLTYTAAAEASGTASITLVLSDDGGTANGGSDTSAPYNFSITVTATNDAPVVTAPAALPVHTHIAVTVADGSAGDLIDGGNVVDPDGPAPYTLGAPLATSTANGGELALDAATGAFDYNPPAGFTGSDSFQYTVCDSDPVPACSAPATMQLNVSGVKIWFVDDSAPAGGDGTLQQPLQTLAAANALAASGDSIFLATGTYAGVTLGAGLDVVGQAVDGASFDAALGIAPPSNSIARPAIDAAYARIEGGLTVGANDTLRGVELDGIGSTALQGNGFGTLDVRDDVRIDSDAGAIALVTGDFAAGSVFAGVSSAGGASNVSFNAVGGSVALGSGTLAGATGTSFQVQGGTLAASYDGSIAKTGAGTLIDVSNHSAGSLAFGGTLSATGPGTAIRIENSNGSQIAFNGASAVLTSNGAATVRIASNPGAEIDFAGGGLVLASSNGIAFDASGGGRIAVRGAGNSIVSTGAAALNVDGVTIETALAAPEGGLRFESISASAGTGSGIALNATGSEGGLTVTGNGGSCTNAATCTGGAITGNGDAGIALSATRGVSLSHMLIDANDGSGIVGNDVTDFAFAAGRVTNNGNAIDGSEANLRFGRLLGTASLTDSVISGSSHDELRMTPNAGVLSSFVISGTSFGPGPGSGIALFADGTAEVTVSVVDGSFAQLGGDGVTSGGNATSRRVLDIDASDFSDNHIGVNLTGGFDADLTYTITDSSFLRHDINPIQVLSSSTSTNASQWVGTISGVSIGDGTPDSGAADLHGIAIEMNGDADSIQSLTGNSVRNTDIDAIFVQTRLDNDADAQIGRHDVALVDNASGTPDDNSAFPFGIVYGNRVEARNTTRMCLDMAGNSAGSVGGLEHFRVRQRDTSNFHFERLTDGDGTPNELINSVALVEGHIAGQNDAGSTADATLVAGFNEADDEICRTP